MQTVTGKCFYPLFPNRDDIEIQDIAFGLAGEFRQQHAALNQSDIGPIVGRRVEDPVAQQDAAGTRHVLDDQCGIARDEGSDVPCDQPGEKVVSAPRVRPDQEVDLLAPIKGLDFIGLRQA